MNSGTPSVRARISFGVLGKFFAPDLLHDLHGFARPQSMEGECGQVCVSAPAPEIPAGQ